MNLDQIDSIDYALSNIRALGDVLQVVAYSEQQLAGVTIARLGQMIEREAGTIERVIKPREASA